MFLFFRHENYTHNLIIMNTILFFVIFYVSFLRRINYIVLFKYGLLSNEMI